MTPETTVEAVTPHPGPLPVGRGEGENSRPMTQAELDGFYALRGMKPHPILTLPTLAQVIAMCELPDGKEQFLEWANLRQEKIGLMETDPFRHGYEPAAWTRAEALIAVYKLLAVTGPNRIGKTEWAAKHVVRKLVEKPGARWWCLCQSHETSIRGGGQQEVIFKYLPPEWKLLNHKRGLRASISYTDKNRFSENVFIGPEGQECRFMNYEQDIKVIEGGSIDGYWADELVPVEWVKTLDGRLIDRAGEGIVTFTPIYGWSETLGLFIQGGTVTETRQFPLFPEMKIWPGLKPGEIPYTMESLDKKRATIFFQLKENPYVPWERLVHQWESSSTAEQLIRLAGVTLKTMGNRFPKFGKAHIVPWSKIPQEGTNWQAIDFAWARPWAMLWARVQRVKDKRRIFIYRDWPDKRTYGEWVLRSSKPNGKPGPAQTSIGMDVAGYKKLMRQLESAEAQKTYEKFGTPHPGPLPVGRGEGENEEIYQRLGDPRSGAAEAVTAEDGGSSFFDMMADEQDTEGPMAVDPVRLLGAKRFIGEGIQKINDWLNYNDDAPLSVTNEPEVFIWEGCEQLIDCLQIWDGSGNQNQQASKDFIDLLRYLAVEDIDDVAVKAARGRAGRGF